MPGGSDAAWPHIKEIFQKTAAQAAGEPCCDWVGQTGSGHYVKMVHNGIEYGDMQLIAEAYDILKRGLDLDEKEIADIFAKVTTLFALRRSVTLLTSPSGTTVSSTRS
jgi:6-phosphogluconate dehydrogenase